MICGSTRTSARPADTARILRTPQFLTPAWRSAFDSLTSMGRCVVGVSAGDLRGGHALVLPEVPGVRGSDTARLGRAHLPRETAPELTGSMRSSDDGSCRVVGRRSWRRLVCRLHGFRLMLVAVVVGLIVAGVRSVSNRGDSSGEAHAGPFVAQRRVGIRILMGQAAIAGGTVGSGRTTSRDQRAGDVGRRITRLAAPSVSLERPALTTRRLPKARPHRSGGSLSRRDGVQCWPTGLDAG